MQNNLINVQANKVSSPQRLKQLFIQPCLIASFTLTFYQGWWIKKIFLTLTFWRNNEYSNPYFQGFSILCNKKTEKNAFFTNSLL